MRAAERLERELDFSLEVPAGELFDSDATEPVLLQGVIDCCFVENGAWVLLDFKTDSAKGKTAEEAAAQHAPQVRVYADALARLTGMRVAEASVVLLEHRQVVQVQLVPIEN